MVNDFGGRRCGADKNSPDCQAILGQMKAGASANFYLQQIGKGVKTDAGCDPHGVDGAAEAHLGFATMQIPQRALNSAVECHLHTVEVTGSNPVAPTN